MRRFSTIALVATATVAFFACKVKFDVEEASSLAGSETLDWLQADDTVHFACKNGSAPYIDSWEFYLNLKDFRYFYSDQMKKSGGTSKKMMGIGAVEVYLTPLATASVTATVSYNAGPYSVYVEREANKPLTAKLAREGSGVISANCQMLTPDLVKFEL